MSKRKKSSYQTKQEKGLVPFKYTLMYRKLINRHTDPKDKLVSPLAAHMLLHNKSTLNLIGV